MRGFKIFCAIATMFAFVACVKVNDDNVEVCSHNTWKDNYCADCGASELVRSPWHLKIFCGTPAEVNLYLKFYTNSKFVILQKSGSLDYTKYSGTYYIDKANSVVSGVYSDGKSWACDYRFSFTFEGELLLESVTDNPEISIYEPAEMPEDTIVKTKACGVDNQSVRPF